MQFPLLCEGNNLQYQNEVTLLKELLNQEFLSKFCISV